MAEDRKAIALQNQEIKNLATQPFTLEAKAQRPLLRLQNVYMPKKENYQGDELSKKV